MRRFWGADGVFLLVSPRVTSGSAVRPRQVPAHSSAAALGQGQGDLGPCPTSPVLGSQEKVTPRPALRDTSGVSSVVIFIPDGHVLLVVMR